MFVFAYGVGAYVVFVLTSLYAVGFAENWIVSRTLDGDPGTAGGGVTALFANVVVLGLFALQHAFMGHPDYKGAWTRLVPEAVERSTRVLVSSVSLMLVFLLWTPIRPEVWALDLHPIGFVLELLSFAGWALVFAGTFQLDHASLFGLAQVLAHVKNDTPEPADFEVPFLYRWVRHPIYFGLLLAVWGAPTMTLGHLLFAALTTVYLVALARMEERELVRKHREYRSYQAHVPMLLPRARPVAIKRRAG